MFRKGRHPHQLASDSAPPSDRKRGPHPEPFRIAPSGNKWTKSIPFPMPRTRPESAPRTFPRDTSPHHANFAARSPSQPRGVTHPRRDTRDHSLRTETTPAPSGELLVGAEDCESEALSSDQVHRDFANNKPRRSRVAHKERGSLRLTYGDFEPSFRNRDRDKVMKPHGSNAKLKSKPKVSNNKKAEVFIPSIVSVGNLSRILRVSLGRPRFIRKHPGLLFCNQVDSSERCGKPEWRKRPPTTTVRQPLRPLRCGLTPVSSPDLRIRCPSGRRI